MSGFRARPTTDFAKESLFNILNNRFDFKSITVLDLFSGTGSISFEFASRGSEVHLVEIDRKYYLGIKRIIDEIGFERIKPVHIDARSYLRTCKYRYDIVFADPPYNLPWISEIPERVIVSGILKEEGILILEHPGTLDFSKKQGFSEKRHYGEVNFTFFEMKRQGIAE